MTSTRQVVIETPDGPMDAYEAAPDSAPKGAVVVVQEAFGVTGHIEDVARRLAGAGWLAVAPAFFHREGSPVLAYDDIESVMPIIGQLSAQGITTDLDATFAYLEAQGFEAKRTGIVGFCMGGTVSFYAATLRPLGAAVTFYGGGLAQGRFGLPALTDLASMLASPWLGLYGDRDAGVPIDDVEALRSAAARAPVATEVVRYPDAEHGFHCDARPSYHEASATDAWRRTLAWFDEHITR